MKHAALGFFLTKGYWDFFLCGCSMHTLPSCGQVLPQPEGYPHKPLQASGRGAALHFTVSIQCIFLHEFLCSFYSVVSLSMPYNNVLTS